MMRPPGRNGIVRKILYWVLYALTVGPFTIIYALTVSPFTVQFFHLFANSPDVGTAMLLGTWPLRQVHEFFLPLFVATLETISIQLSAFVWGLGMKRAMVPVLIVLLMAQAFPTFSVYLDSRNTELQAKNAQQALAEGQSTQKKADAVKQLHDLSDAKIKDLNAKLDDVNARIAKLQQQPIATSPYDNQLSDLKGRLADVEAKLIALKGPDLGPSVSTDIIYNGLYEQRNTLNSRIESVQRDRVISITDQTLAENNRLNQLSKDYLASIQQERVDLQRSVSDPALGSSSFNLSPGADTQPKYANATEYMVGTAGTLTGLLSLFVALIFPTIVLAAGYVIARYGGGTMPSGAASQAAVPYFQLGDHLAPAGGLSKEIQNGFAGGIKTSVEFYATALRAVRDYQSAYTTFKLDENRIIEEVKMLVSVKEDIRKSGLGQTERDALLAHMDTLIAVSSQ